MTFETLNRILIFVIFFLLLALSCFHSSFEPFAENEAEIKFPFKPVLDDKGKRLNVIAITAPFRSDADMKKYQDLKNKGYEFLGVSSYINFPDNHIINPFDDRYSENNNIDYLKMVSAWLYCFRQPTQQMIESGLPLALITEADLKNPVHVQIKNAKKKYDFIYVCLDDNDKCIDGWQSYNRNWKLAKECLKIMCGTFKMKGLIVGRKNCEFTDLCKDLVKVVPFLPYHKFLEEMEKARFLFVPNISDASPRVITEALLLDVPVLVNQNILGGWHNVISGVTGEFFNDERDIEQALRKLTQSLKSYQPRKWYEGNRGVHNSGKELAEFLKKHYPKLENTDFKYATV
jgi:hypothetical protein